MDPLAMIVGIKNAVDLAKVIGNIANDIDLKTKTAELYNSIISLQTGIMEMQAENSSLLQKNDSLTKKLMEFEAWENEKSKYFLKEICPQVFVYCRDTDNDKSEPTHWICAQCYNKGVKSILQMKDHNSSGAEYICHNCSCVICDFSNKKQVQHYNPGRNKTW